MKAIKLELVEKSEITNRHAQVIVTCPAGKRLTGGGGRCISLSAIGYVFITDNYPNNDHEWKVSCDSLKDQQVQAVAHAICS